MASNKMVKAELIVWLRDSIRFETAKAEEEMDMDFVNDCMELLSVLLDDKYNLTDEQLEEKLMQIKATKRVETVNKVSRKAAMKFRRTIAVCAAVVFLCAGVTVCAFNPTIRDMILSVIDSKIGESMEHAGITYTYRGKEIIYEDIQTLIDVEELEIMYPQQLPDGIYINEIIQSEDASIIEILFSRDDLHITIMRNEISGIEKLIGNGAEQCEINGIPFYFVEKDNNFVSTILTDNWIYYINGADKNQIRDVIAN